MRLPHLALLALLPSMLAVANAAAPPPAVPTAFNVNLVKNPGGAPKGGVSPDGYTVVAIPGWRGTNEFTLAPYGGDWPAKSESNRIHGGKTFFSGGGTLWPPKSETSRAFQVIPVNGRAQAIDAGKVRVKASAWLATYGSQSDSAQIIVQFIGANGQLLGSMKTAAVSQTHTVFIEKSASALAPAGTRKLKVILQAVRGEGAYRDGYFDNVDVRITQVG